jgi:hypothetical protein
LCSVLVVWRNLRLQQLVQTCSDFDSVSEDIYRAACKYGVYMSHCVGYTVVSVTAAIVSVCSFVVTVCTNDDIFSAAICLPLVIAGQLAICQNTEGHETCHLGTGFAWFPCVYKQMLRWFSLLQVATACLSCSPPPPI